MERRLFDEIAILVSPRMERAGFLAAFTERSGGSSEPPFDTLNLGLKTADDRGAVLVNRRRAIDSLGIGPWSMGFQVHGAHLVRVGASRYGAGFEDPDTGVGEADALSVRRPRQPVAVITADCLPIALADPAGGRMVAVHAGWRGLAAGILGRAVEEVGRPADALAAIGPAIGPCHYEVGEDVALAVSARTPGGAVVERRGGSLFLDLPRTASRQLRAAGVRRIETAKECTACHPDRFFSHRRDGATGRQGLIAMRL